MGGAPAASKRSSTRGQSARRWAITAREVDVPWRERRTGGADLGLGEQSVLDQPFEADQQRIAGKRGEALVRRVAVAGRSERQHLPEPLAGGGEQIDELEGARPEIADAEAARQRGRMEEHAARHEETRIVRLAGYRCGAASVSRSFLRPELLLEQLLRGVSPAQPERDRQSQHQRAERDGERRQHDRRGESQLLERHHDADRDHEDAQRAAQQARAGQPGVHRRQQRGPPEEVADEEAERRAPAARPGSAGRTGRTPRRVPETARTAACRPPTR